MTNIAVNGPIIEWLMRSVKAGRIVHAFLFVGARGTGKRTAARSLAQAIFCKGEDKPCGACPQCRRVIGQTHPDVHTLAAAGKSIGVDEIRQMLAKVAMKPYEGERHVVLIQQADKMTPAAQNALLKTLESPAGSAVFLLITDMPSAILPTIHSRCQRVRFADLAPDACAAALVERGIAPERAELLAELAQGSVGRGLEIDADKVYFPLRGRVLDSLGMLGGANTVARAAQLLAADKDNSENVLEIIELFARDLAAVQNGQAPFEKSEAKRLGESKLSGSALLMGTIEMRRKLASNVQWISALEDMYLKLVGPV